MRTLQTTAFALIASLGVTCANASAATHSAGADPVLLKSIDALVAAMNRSDDRAISALLTPDAVIQDEVTPYRWLGPNAEAKWSHDDGLLIVKRGVTHSHSRRGTPTFVHRSGNHAFAVVPLVYTYVLKKRQQRETGLWTIVLQKTGTVWRISLLGFAKTSDTSDATWNGR